MTFDDFMRYYKQSLDFLNQRRILLSQRKAFREHQGRMPLMQVFCRGEYDNSRLSGEGDSLL